MQVQLASACGQTCRGNSLEPAYSPAQLCHGCKSVLGNWRLARSPKKSRSWRRPGIRAIFHPLAFSMFRERLASVGIPSGVIPSLRNTVHKRFTSAARQHVHLPVEEETPIVVVLLRIFRGHNVVAYRRVTIEILRYTSRINVLLAFCGLFVSGKGSFFGCLLGCKRRVSHDGSERADW